MKLIIISLSIFLTFNVFAEVKVGSAAPTFSEIDHNGKTRNLKEFKGQWVVLEWFNEDCPYVKKHYSSNNMQTLQKKFTDKGVKWLTIISSAKGMQGYIAPKFAKAQFTRAKMNSSALLLDPDGTMGRTFGAKTTPHMYIINPKGTVVYAGAIDSNDSANPNKIKGATNYVNDALTASLAGAPIKTASTTAYGCSVKYK